MQGKCKDLSNDESYQLMDSLIEAEHILRIIDAEIDFSFVDTATESLFSPNRGRESIPPQQYFKMLLIKHWYNISSVRKLLEAMQHNVAYRWFCGFSLREKLPDPSSFTNLKNRFGAKIFEQFFNAILQQCIAKGLVQSESVMTDSTLFNANASLDSLERRDGSGLKRKGEKLANKTHRSRTDPDATLAYKSGTTRTLKYKAHVCSDSKSRVITNIKITTGSVHDSVPYLTQLNTLIDSGLVINEAIADRAYGTADNLVELDKIGIDSNIPLFSSRSGSAKSAEGMPGFIYREESNDYLCPGKKILKACKSKEDTVLYLSKTADCAACPLASTCQAKTKNGGPARLVSRNKHTNLFKKIKIKMEQPEFKEKLHQRMWMIEGIMNELKNCHGLNRANYRGLKHVETQGYMAAIAINIKRIIFYWLWILLIAMIAF